MEVVNLPAQLRSERARAGMDFETLEVLSELPAERLRALEDGSASPLDELQQLAAVFGLRTSALLERAENRAALRLAVVTTHQPRQDA